MTVSRASGAGPDARFYVPDTRLFSDGQQLPARLRAGLSSLSVTTALDAVDRLELRFANDELRWLDHPTLAVDRELKLELGYAGRPLPQLFVGEVVSISPTFPASGMPVLTVAAHDRRHKMQQGTKSRSFRVSIPGWGNKPLPDPVVTGLVLSEHQLVFDSDPVSIGIAAALGAVAEGAGDSPADAHDAIRKQNGESDLSFLGHIAVENGWGMTVQHDGALGGRVVRFRSLLSDLSPRATLRYGTSLFEFSPRLTTVGQIFAVKARFRVEAMKAEMTVAVRWNWDRQSLEIEVVPDSGGTGGTGDDKGPAYTLVDQQVSISTVARVILGKLIPKLNQRLTASGSALGDPTLKPGDVVRIEGVGARYGGLYRLTSVTHTLDSSGFRTTFDARKEVWFDDGHLARGLVPAVSGPFGGGDRGNPIFGGMR